MKVYEALLTKKSDESQVFAYVESANKKSAENLLRTVYPEDKYEIMEFKFCPDIKELSLVKHAYVY